MRRCACPPAGAAGSHAGRHLRRSPQAQAQAGGRRRDSARTRHSLRHGAIWALPLSGSAITTRMCRAPASHALRACGVLATVMLQAPLSSCSRNSSGRIVVLPCAASCTPQAAVKPRIHAGLGRNALRRRTAAGGLTSSRSIDQPAAPAPAMPDAVADTSMPLPRSGADGCWNSFYTIPDTPRQVPAAGGGASMYPVPARVEDVFTQCCMAASAKGGTLS